MENQEKTKLKTKDKAATPAWYIAKRVLRSRGISYERLADMLGCSTTSVFDFVNYTPNVIRIFQMAKATGIPFLDFFDLDLLNADIAEGDANHGDCPNDSSEAQIRGTVPVIRDGAHAVCPSCGAVLSVVLNELDAD